MQCCDMTIFPWISNTALNISMYVQMEQGRDEILPQIVIFICFINRCSSRIIIKKCMNVELRGLCIYTSTSQVQQNNHLIRPSVCPSIQNPFYEASHGTWFQTRLKPTQSLAIAQLLVAVLTKTLNNWPEASTDDPVESSRVAVLKNVENRSLKKCRSKQVK